MQVANSSGNVFLKTLRPKDISNKKNQKTKQNQHWTTVNSAQSFLYFQFSKKDQGVFKATLTDDRGQDVSLFEVAGKGNDTAHVITYPAFTEIHYSTQLSIQKSINQIDPNKTCKAKAHAVLFSLEKWPYYFLCGPIIMEKV